MNDKMIEEMAKVINVRCEAELGQVHAISMNGKVTKTVDTSLIAKDIYNAGYRKIPEGSVVLTKEEYAELIEIKNRVNKLWSIFRKELEDTRKETAKEILQSLLDFVNCEKINQGHSFEKIKETLIKVAKTYEVEVEE